ncbi:hypothetical protein J2Z40_003418 [Cytobacillus eiseniae]|uniref:RocC n=1 Tax=Cytobacillus eiseniae TaxID=762947 RepID=A0ABS4RLZ2_9BACI|nr:DUF1850 domain-containing protein [Cytobacillus eiseniae]MBP2242837.1 hypothetical protein [Cytobacillus eiseniae]
MKEKKPDRKMLILVSLILISIVFLFFIPLKQALVFQYQHTGKVLAYIPIHKDEQFKIKYLHSIHRSDVIESYLVTKDKQIKQYELMYEDFAIGMPENASEGEIFEHKDGKYFIKNMNRIFPLFDLRLGKVRANHTLIYKELEYPLSRYIEPGTLLRIKIDKISVFEQLKGVNILE